MEFTSWPGYNDFHGNSLITVDRVLVICSEAYLEKANKNKGGVGYEKMIVNADILKDLSSTKYIPIILLGEKIDQPPIFFMSDYIEIQLHR